MAFWAVVVHRLDRAVAGGAGDRMDDGGALIDERRGELLALGRVVPGVVAADERPARVAVPAEELDGGAVNLVVTGDAGVHAVHETGDARELLAAVGADLPGLRVPGRQIAGEHRRLVDVVVETREVRRMRGVILVAAGEVRSAQVPGRVDLGEREIGVELGRSGRGIALEEA